MASGFPWGGWGCQVGASIDPDQLVHASKELTAECLCSAQGEAVPLWEGALGTSLCPSVDTQPCYPSPCHQGLAEHWLVMGPACVLNLIVFEHHTLIPGGFCFFMLL